MIGEAQSPTRGEKLAFGLLVLLFFAFTWRALTMFYSGDDMMNMWKVWMANPWRLGRAVFFPWEPVYRPLGGVIYRIFYTLNSFHPEPLYILCYVLLLANLYVAWRFFATVAEGPVIALCALALALMHGNFQDLYVSAGTIYDRLVFLFTALPVIVYARMRNASPARIPLVQGALVWFLCLLAMDAKESGVTVPAILLAWECVFFGNAMRRSPWQWLRSTGLFYASLALLALTFVFGRVERTADLVTTPGYQPRIDVSVWLARVATYFTSLAYSHIHFNSAAAAAVLAAMLILALALRNRPMLFGWLFFVIAVTPVALITERPGYVLYVPGLGLALWLAAFVGAAVRVPGHSSFTARTAALFLAVTALSAGYHAYNWVPFPSRLYSPEYLLTRQLRSDFPSLPHGARLLFVNDAFPRPAYDLMFNVQLLYHDNSIIVKRMEAPPDQQPAPGAPLVFDHVFVQEGSRYLELDNSNIEESIRLHTLRYYRPGRYMDVTHPDHGAYVVSGVLDSDDINNPGRWTLPVAQLKFDVYPANSRFTLKIFAADVVAAPDNSLTVLVNGKSAGVVPLDKPGLKEVSFPVPASNISRSGYTLVDLVAARPAKGADGSPLGVVLATAGFEYVNSAK